METRVERFCPKVHPTQGGRHLTLRRRTGRWPDEALTRCPRLAYDELEHDPRFISWLEDYSLFAAGGVLRRAGGIEEQPIAWLDAMRAIHSAVKDYEAEQLRPIAEGGVGVDEEPPANADPRHHGFAHVEPPYGRRPR